MLWKLVKNDIRHNLFQTCNIAFFIILSAAFLATAGQLTLRLSLSIDQLFEKAQTPHLLQMHKGKVDYERMRQFVDSHPEIEEYQILDFLNIDNSLLSFNGNSLKDSVYDNGFSVQSPHFDYLLDLKGEIIRARKGEVYVPVFYHTLGLVKEGDLLNIQDHSLRVAGFVRDSQMNSSLSVSKRFILSKEDYQTIRSLGIPEYLIEFRLHDLSRSSEIERAYAENHLESNGPPFLTYSLFKIVNAFSDGITIAALLMISLLMIGICLLCIRFTLLARLEEDYRELAVLRAIGIPLRQIRKIFLGKYLFIAGVSTLVGFLLSFLLRIPLLQNMKMFFGEKQSGLWGELLGLLLSLLLFLVIFLSMKRLSKRLQHLSLSLSPLESEGACIRFLSAFPRSLQLSFRDLLARKKVYSSLVLLFILSVFILTLPMSILSTISDENFVHYLGIGSYDVRIDLSRMPEEDPLLSELIRELEADSSIAKFEIFRSKLADYKAETGEWQKIWIELGNQESFPIQYLKGRPPEQENEIALSGLKAEDLSKEVGDSLNLQIGDREKTVIVTGIFSDLTNGGKTAKATFETEGLPTIWTLIPLQLKEGVSPAHFIDSYRSKYPFAKFSDTKTYLQQIFGNTIAMVKRITGIALIACIFLIFLIVSLFTGMLYLKDQGQNALLKAVGFTGREIRRQYHIKIALISLTGLLLGNALILSLGDFLGAGLLSLIGVRGVRFLRDPLFSYLFVPFILLLSSFSATAFGIRGLRKIRAAQLLKEDL